MMKLRLPAAVLFFLSITTLLLFQNCGGQYKVNSAYLPSEATPAELSAELPSELAGAKDEHVVSRLAASESSSALRFQLGDTFEYVVRDLIANVDLDPVTVSVIDANSDVASLSNGSKITQSGQIIVSFKGATMSPYQQWFPPGDYIVGKKWSTASKLTTLSGNSANVVLTGEIVAKETITVPAGTFDTYRIEFEQTADDNSLLKISYWAQPEWGAAVKQIREVYADNDLVQKTISELTNRKRR
jgi:hypothetical protein